MHWVKMYLRYLSVYFKQLMEYRFSFFGDIFVNTLFFIVTYIGFWVIFNRFDMLHGWTFYEVTFLYNMNLLSYAISSMFVWGPMKQLEEYVRRGEFDLFLTKPIPPLRLLIFRQFGHTFIGHVLVAVTVFIVCIDRLDLQWSFTLYVFFVAAIIGAAFIHSALIIFAATSTFWIVRSTPIVDVTIYAIRSYINYPISIYYKWLQVLLTFLVPYAFVNFYPSTVLLRKTESLSILSYCTPILGLILLGAAVCTFNIGVRRYESTGS
ncbi:ABC transporter permease [Cohnella soli]|uniref:ABC transporter permease n=1 Tax=Cohnella soli TaxID=425005 RepID=A0ABW0HSM4_9BACL